MIPEGDAQPDRDGAPTPRQALSYDGRVSELYGIFLLNLLLTIVTLGIYRFWAITRLRRYMWSRMRFQGDRLEYAGTGLELFLGFLIAIVILVGFGVVIGVLIALARMIRPPLVLVPMLLLYLAIVILSFAGIFSAQRYRLSRTLWRGIRGGMRGSALVYGVRALLYLMLNVLTLYQAGPWMTVRLAERRLNASGFGNLGFRFCGRARRVYLPYLAQLLVFVALSIVFLVMVYRTFGTALIVMARYPQLAQTRPDVRMATTILPFFLFAGMIVIGLITALVRSFYVAALACEVANNTGLGPLRFSSRVSGWALLRLGFGNLLILLFTLGLGYPIVVQRNARLLAASLLVSGAIDPATLRQSAEAGPAFGEGMFQALDAGGGFL